MLLAYKIHRGYKNAWRVGMKGSGDYYGSLFHKHIAQVFFEAASNPRNKLHQKILDAILKGSEELEELISYDIFMPFVTKYSKRLTSGQITSMAKGVTTWVKAMYDFFREIPSLAKDAETIFIKPELDLHGNFDLDDGRLVIKGRYDALMFNVDKSEARLFEFKGLKKSNVTVPLSQTLIYAWLLYKSTGIIPSIEIIYLDEDEPIIFASRTVREMIISALPGLFTTTFNMISLRRAPEILSDKELCKACKYETECEATIETLFRKKRSGMSLISVMIFFLAAALIMTQAFFFTTNSSETLAEERELVGIKMALENKIEEAKKWLKTNSNSHTSTNTIYNNTFYKETMISPDKSTTYDNTGRIGNLIKDWDKNQDVIGKIFLSINDLNYTLDTAYNNTEQKRHEKVFAAMGEGYYLIRAYTKLQAGTSLMYQVLVHKDSSNNIEVKSYEEVWYK